MKELDHAERISSLEAGQKALTENVNRFIDASSDSIKALAQDIKAMALQQGKAHFPTYISAAVLATIVGTAVLQPIWSRLGRLSDTDNLLQTRLSEHEKLGIHPIADERLKNWWLLFQERRRADLNRIEKIERALEKNK